MEHEEIIYKALWRLAYLQKEKKIKAAKPTDFYQVWTKHCTDRLSRQTIADDMIKRELITSETLPSLTKGRPQKRYRLTAKGNKHLLQYIKSIDALHKAT